MSLLRIIQAILPSPRRPLTRWSVLPLVLFLILFVGTCAVLEMTHVILFSTLLPFAFLVITPWLWWMHVAGYSGLNPRRALWALLARLLLFGLFIVLLAEPRAVRKHDALSIIFVVDISASIDPVATNEETMTYIVNTVANKPEMDEAGLLFFGRDAAVELAPNISFPYEAINVQVNRDGTNLAQALSLAAAMLPQENQGRIVLISDGIETTGDLGNVLDDLKARKVPVDVLPIQYDYEHEVWLQRLELPRFVKSGETYEAAVILSSLQPGEGKLTLQENGQVIFSDAIQFKAGKNRFTVPIYLRQPGYYEYTAHIEMPRDKDKWTKNNRAISYLYLKGKGKVLLVSDPEGNDLDWEPLTRALIEAERDVERLSAYAFPRDPLALLPYDCIIFPNVPADAFDQQQLEALHDAIYNQATGFLMIGGKNSFGPGGYRRTPVEQVLPVDMDISQKKILPKGALAIILHTCEFDQGNTWGKRITKQAVKVLDDRDEVGVLVYGPRADQWLFPLTPASEFPRLAQLINNAQIGDMPSFATTMQLGLLGLQASDAATKHMIIISDGDPSPPPPPLVNQFITAGVSVSMVAIFPHGGQDISKMQMVANVTGGRYYFPNNPNKLPSIFIKEAKTLRRSAIQNKTFVPTVAFSSPILKGVDALPPLHGYVLTTPKARSKTVLEGPEEEDLDPVLSTWRYGLGATAAFTSDLSPNWGADWVQWERYRAFVKQLVTDISRVSNEGSLRMRSFPAGGQGMILIEDYAHEEAFLEVQAQVEAPGNATHSISLKQVGPRRYEGRFPLAGQGRYQIRAAGVGEGREENAHGGFVVPYSQEYLRFRSNQILLDQIAQKTGGRVLNRLVTGEALYSPPREPKQSSQPIVDWFLILLACLVVLDVALRRVQLDLDVIKSWFGVGRATPLSDETFSALLSRKKDVAATLQHQPEPQAAASLLLNRTGRPEVEPASSGASSPAQQQETDGDALSTTERLLAAKRRAQTPEEDSDGNEPD